MAKDRTCIVCGGKSGSPYFAKDMCKKCYSRNYYALHHPPRQKFSRLKLTDGRKHILQLLDSGYTQSYVAQKLGCSRQYINSVAKIRDKLKENIINENI